jgi:hypothetical protein
VFNEATSQSQVFEQSDVSSLVQRVVQGFHATVFVYGQTGSGKTYTMEGYPYREQGVPQQFSATGNNFGGSILPVIPESHRLNPLKTQEDEGIIPRAIR